MEAQLGKLKGLMVQEADRITAQLRAERDLAVQNVGKLQAKLDALRNRSNQADLAQVKLRQLQAKAAAARSVLDDFLKRSQETSQLKGMQISQVRVISSAAAPIAPTWPKPKLLLPVAALLGLLAGSVLALLAGPRAAARAQSRETGDGAVVPVPAIAASAGRPAGGRALPRGPKPRRCCRCPQPPRRRRPARQPKGLRRPLADLGIYAIPMHAGLSLRSMVKSIRIEMQNAGNSPLSLAVLRLLRQIIGRLSEHAEPFVLFVSSIDRGVEAKLAAAMIGIGLRHLDERVLIVEMADQAEEPGPLLSVSSRRGTSVFTDPSTRLPTVVVGGEDEIDAVLARHRATSTSSSILGRALGEAELQGLDRGARRPGGLRPAPTTTTRAPPSSCGEHFAGEDVSRKTTIVIAAAEQRCRSQPVPPASRRRERSPRQARDAQRRLGEMPGRPHRPLLTRRQAMAVLAAPALAAALPAGGRSAPPPETAAGPLARVQPARLGRPGGRRGAVPAGAREAPRSRLPHRATAGRRQPAHRQRGATRGPPWPPSARQPER